MEIKEFAEIIKKELGKKTEREVKIHEVTKNNGVILHGINIMEPESNVVPTIYIESFFNDFENGRALEEITEDIWTMYQREKLSTSLNMDWFRDFEIVKDKIAYKIINFEANKELLERVPHERFLDLAKVYYVTVNLKEVGNGTILIYNTHLDMWGITVERLAATAEENTPKLFPLKFGSICDIMKDLMDVNEFEDVIKDCPMYIATNHAKTFGAAVLCYADTIKKVAEKMQSDLYIIPSSTHEIIIVLPMEDGSAESLKEMVYEVNRTQLREDEVLSDSVYYYSRETDRITIA